MKRKNKALLIILVFLLFLIGLTIMLYPYFQGASADATLEQNAEAFYERLETIPPVSMETRYHRSPCCRIRNYWVQYNNTMPHYGNKNKPI